MHVVLEHWFKSSSSSDMGGRVGTAVVPVPFTNAARVRFPVGSESHVNLVLDPY